MEPLAHVAGEQPDVSFDFLRVAGPLEPARAVEALERGGDLLHGLDPQAAGDRRAEAVELARAVNEVDKLGGGQAAVEQGPALGGRDVVASDLDEVDEVPEQFIGRAVGRLVLSRDRGGGDEERHGGERGGGPRQQHAHRAGGPQ